MTDTDATTPTTTQLPPDPEGMNDSRADWATYALVAFQSQTGTDDESALADLLCGLMHLCDRDSRLGNFDNQLERARMHYNAETGGESGAMRRYQVKVAVKTLEIYAVEADTPEAAADDWGLGRLLNADDEALESEVLSVEEL